MNTPDTFQLSLYRVNPLGGFTKVIYTVDQNGLIVGENTATVKDYSKVEAHKAFSNMFVTASQVLMKGVMAERQALMARMQQEKLDASGNKVVVPTEEALAVIRILNDSTSPCKTERCEQIRKAYRDELEAAAKEGGCSSCKRSQILSKYQKQLLDEKITS